MKTILVKCILFYQQFFSLPLRMIVGVSATCRYPQSCSEYAIFAISTEGVIRGGRKAAIRILSCQPFTR